MDVTLPYWRLSFFYFVYFASLAGLSPYFGLYLSKLGFDPRQIGELTAIILLTKLVAPNIWGWIGDHSGLHITLVRIGSLVAILCFSGIFIGSSYGWLALVFCSFSFFWNAILPQMEAITLFYLGNNTVHYSRIRLWGSIGFIITVVALGWLFNSISVMWLPLIILGLLSSIFLSSLLISEKKMSHETQVTDSIWQILRSPPVIALLSCCFLLQASHGAYYTFYSIYLEQSGYNRILIGQLWALGVISEVIMFLFIRHLFTYFNPHTLFILTFAVTACRWLLISFGIQFIAITIFAQMLHAVSFGLFHAVAMQFIHRYFPGRLRARGQALYASIGFGAGNGLGSLGSGYAWESVGPQVTFIISAALCVVAVFIAIEAKQMDKIREL
ncbi:MAG: MFS transporter [Thiotrichaceae bacterium]